MMTDVARRALEARHILDNPLVKEAFEALERHFYESWLAVPIDQVESAEKWRMMGKLVATFRAHFESVIQTGKFETAMAEARKIDEEFEKLNYNPFDEKPAHDSKTEYDYIKEYREMNSGNR